MSKIEADDRLFSYKNSNCAVTEKSSKIIAIYNKMLNRWQIGMKLWTFYIKISRTYVPSKVKVKSIYSN